MAQKSKARPALDSKTEEQLIRIFRKPVVDARKVNRQLLRLAQTGGDAVFSHLLFLLVHLEFAPRAARRQWEEVLEHHALLKRKLGRPIDLRVAVLDYFVSENRKLKNPKILELHIYQMAQREALSDELTNLYNYRYFEKALNQEIKRADRLGEPLSLLLLDIDDFKHYNDRNGHLAGNQVLRQVAGLLGKNVRQIDIVCRYGGEEFAVLLPSTSKQGALLTAERMRQAIEKTKFPFNKFQPKKMLTVSGGIASYPVDAKSPRELVERADTALYRAKSDGKNNIKVFLTETRSFTRVDSRLVGSFTVLAEKNVRLATRDVSKNGILFESNKSVTIGSELNMTIRIPRAKPVHLRAQVVRVERMGSKRFDIGVTIVQMSATDRKRFENHVDALMSAG